MREQPLLIVWDNFESVARIPGTEVTPLLSDEDRQRLKALLKRLRGGKSKILITSRSPESWLAPTEVYRVSLEGLSGEERWEYCNAVVRDLGLRVERNDTHYAELMDELDGHPLAMRAVLLRLAEKSAEQLLAELKKAFAGAQGDESTRRIFAALSLLDQGLPDTYAPVLPLIGLHRRYVAIDYLEQIGQGTNSTVERETLNSCFIALENGGLLHHQGSGLYHMHPALSGYLAGHHPADKAQQRAFVDFMRGLAVHLAAKGLHAPRSPFAIYGTNFHQALALAVEERMNTHIDPLKLSLALFAHNRRDFTAARRLYESLAEHREAVDNQEMEAGAYYELGRIAREQRDFVSAKDWCQKALAISEKQGNEFEAALTYHELGRIAEEQHDFVSSGGWLLKAIGLFVKVNDPHNLVIALNSYARILKAADGPIEADLRRRWQVAGLDRLISLDKLEQAINARRNVTGRHQ